jgi:hypothetical protein
MAANLAKGRAETQFGEANKYIGELENKIQEEIKARNAEITRYGELRARFNRIKKQKGTSEIITSETVVEVPVEREVVRGLLYEAVTDKTLVPITELRGHMKDRILEIHARILPYPNPDREVPWQFMYRLSMGFGLKFVETRTPTGAINHYAELYALDAEGKPVQQLELERFNMIVEKPDAKQWFWWAPHLDVAALLMTGATPRLATGGSLGVSLFGYGLTVNDLDWRVLRVSMDLVDGVAGLGLTPATYNLGTFIPLISNLWIGPHGSYDVNMNWKLGLLVGGVL